MDASDDALIERSLAGDLGAFDELMARYQGLVFKVAMTCARDRDEALDISQNAFLKAYERLASLRDAGSFKYWVARIAHREGINWALSRRAGGRPPPLCVRHRHRWQRAPRHRHRDGQWRRDHPQRAVIA